MTKQPWLGVIAGNSKLHWARFEPVSLQRNRLDRTWDTPHLTKPLRQPGLELSDLELSDLELPGLGLPDLELPDALPIYFASVVHRQSELIAHYGNAREITLADIPIGRLYPTLGIDRALALLGAGDRHGYPILVIDGGTAITLTGADGDRNLVGGAILPGLQLQFDSLGLGTAALPRLNLSAGPDSTKPGTITAELPERWALSTEGAIASGILHSLAHGIEGAVVDWLERYPNSSIITTGGSGPWIAAQLAALPQAKGAVSDLGLCGLLAWRRQSGA